MDDEKYYCLYCGVELDFKPTEDGGFCPTECEDSWYLSGGMTKDEITDREGDIKDDFDERSKGLEGLGPMTEEDL